MGIVIRESIKSSIASYTGLVIGMINVIFLYTKFLSPEQLGLTRVLQDSTLLFVSFAQLGSPFILIKFFPQFAKNKNYSGFLTFIITYSFFGFLIFTFLFLILQNTYLHYYADKSPLLIQYFIYIVPFVLGMVFINTLESFIIIQNKIFFPTIIREIFLKLSNTIIITLFATGIIGFNNFINLMVLSYFIAVFFLTFYIKKLGLLNLKADLGIWNLKTLKPILRYGIFTILGGIGFLLSSKIDTIMLPAFEGLKETAVYSIALLMVTIMEIPKRSLVRSVLPSLSIAINKNDNKVIDDLYKKTSINLFIWGLLIFVLFWVNIDDIFKIIPNGELYRNGKSVIYFFLFSRIIDLVTGVNNEIIIYSRFYTYGLILIIMLGVLTVITNLIFIPLLGIVGAALATTISLVVYLIIELVIVWLKFHSQPFSLNTLKALGLFLIVWLLAFLLNSYFSGITEHIPQNFTGKIEIGVAILLKSFILTAIFIYFFMKFKISNDFSGLITGIYIRLKNMVLKS